MSPVTWPANPPGLMVTTPAPLLNRTPTSSAVVASDPGSPRKSETPVKPSRTTFAPAAVRVCSNSTTPLSVWPNRVTFAGWSAIPTCTRRVFFGTEMVASMPPMFNVWLTADGVVLICSSTCRPPARRVLLSDGDRQPGAQAGRDAGQPARLGLGDQQRAER